MTILSFNFLYSMCISPITLHIRGRHFGSNTGSYQVPCGKCLECKKKYQNDWFVRMVEHTKDFPDVYFITLTYRPECLPLTLDCETGEVNFTVYKGHVQKWLKRLRMDLTRSFGRDLSKNPIFYFCTSEYSPKHKLPHYHLIIWNVKRYELFKSLGDWFNRYGRFDCQKPKGNGCINYVAKYCAKACFENPKVEDGSVFPTFHLISKNIGKGYLERMKTFHLQPSKDISNRRVNLYYSKQYLEVVADNLFYNYYNKKTGQVVKYHLPRYYRDRILKHEIFVGRRDLRNNCVVRCKYFISSALSNQIKDFLSERVDKVRDLQCGKLLAENSALSYGQAFSIVLKEEASRLYERNKKLIEFYKDFYSKGKVERGLLTQT